MPPTRLPAFFPFSPFLQLASHLTLPQNQHHHLHRSASALVDSSVLYPRFQAQIRGPRRVPSSPSPASASASGGSVSRVLTRFSTVSTTHPFVIPRRVLDAFDAILWH
ncbi:hypothetical protein BD410DRAFT_797232 [Rickenella mellea]|uniref:Uncharacterized protein n=1 Tax=Rickenella mellea TaxID=50990 RepID=A0A4Y7PH22_9AGAM|nr:hypothetical protein BD410DRAFT_797232 [Rickenella mellea]